MTRLLPALLGLCVPFSLGFAFPQKPFHVKPTVRSSPLQVSSLSIELDDEATYRYLLSKARECAFSDAICATEARQYLNRILEIESGCASGLLAGHDLCDNIEELVEVVALLRRKANATSVVVNNPSQYFVGVPALLLSLFCTLVILSTVDFGQEASPFTIEEWVWAAKGGYLNNMIHHYLINGGI